MNEKETKILVFTINGEYYAADIIDVERILGYEETTKLPDSPDFIQGVINYEGDILPIISLAKRFNMPLKTSLKEEKIIVVKQEENKIGVIVDEVSEVIDVNVDSIESPPEIVSFISKRYIKGLIKLDKKIIIFLNFNKILTEDEKKSI